VFPSIAIAAELIDFFDKLKTAIDRSRRRPLRPPPSPVNG
jgi:hypothetical protein